MHACRTAVVFFAQKLPIVDVAAELHVQVALPLAPVMAAQHIPRQLCGATPHAEIVGLPHVSFVNVQEKAVHLSARGATPLAEKVGLPQILR